MLDLIQKLAQTHGPSGHEDKIRDLIQDLAEPYADDISTDTLGNLIVFKKGKPNGKKIMIAAHMDTIGMIITHIDDKGFIRFANLGYLNPTDILNTPVKFANGIRGVVAKEDKVKPEDLKLFHLYIDIGATSKEEAEQQIQITDTAVYATDTYQTQNTIISPYLDNRIGCAILLKAMEKIKNPINDLYFVFTVQEEVGLRGAKTAAFNINPDIGIAIDVTDTGDVPGLERPMDTKLGAGTAIKIIDSSLICNPKLTQTLKQTAITNNIPHQLEVLLAGGTDAGPIQLNQLGTLTAALSIPTRLIHTPQELAHTQDIQATIDLLTAFLTQEQ